MLMALVWKYGMVREKRAKSERMLDAAWAMGKALVWALEMSGSDIAYCGGDGEGHGEGGGDVPGVGTEVEKACWLMRVTWGWPCFGR